MTTSEQQAVPVAQEGEFATVEAWEHGDQRELSSLYNHRADDSLQFNRGQMRTAIRHGKRLASLPCKSGEGAETDRLMHVIDRDRYVVAHCLAAIKEAVAGRTWLLEGRGPYEWDDDDYRKEFGDALRAIQEAAEPLAVVGWDKSDCTRIEERVNAAKLAARELLAKKHGPREMIPADIFGDPRDLEIARLTAALALTPDATQTREAELVAAIEAEIGMLKGADSSWAIGIRTRLRAALSAGSAGQ